MAHTHIHTTQVAASEEIPVGLMLDQTCMCGQGEEEGLGVRTSVAWAEGVLR